MKQTVLGLTGSIGMGKTTVSAMLREEGIPVFCADTINHAMRGPNGEALPIYEQFVPGSTGAAGADMEKIKEFVYASPGNLMGLTQAILPLMLNVIMQFKYDHRDHEIIALDIPLLFELDLADLCDEVAVVSAGEDEQRRRVLARGKMTEVEFEKIKGAQLPDEEKRRRADYIIDTSGTLDDTRNQIREILLTLGSRKETLRALRDTTQ